GWSRSRRSSNASVVRPRSPVAGTSSPTRPRCSPEAINGTSARQTPRPRLDAAGVSPVSQRREPALGSQKRIPPRASDLWMMTASGCHGRTLGLRAAARLTTTPASIVRRWGLTSPPAPSMLPSANDGSADEIRRRVWYAVRRSRFEQDLADEMAFHREITLNDLKARGLSPPEASHVAAAHVRQRSPRRERLARTRTFQYALALAANPDEVLTSHVGGERIHHRGSDLQRHENAVEVHRRAAEDLVTQRRRDRVQNRRATAGHRRLADAACTNRRLRIRELDRRPRHMRRCIEDGWRFVVMESSGDWHAVLLVIHPLLADRM